MKLLLDENLSPKIAKDLNDLFPDSLHVREVELQQSTDNAIWDFAKGGGYTIATTDRDFLGLANLRGAPPKIIWLRSWQHPTRDAIRVFRREAIRIAEFGAEPDTAILILDR